MSVVRRIEVRNAPYKYLFIYYYNIDATTYQIISRIPITFRFHLGSATNISLLILSRAKVQLENKKGHTALDVAKAYADPRVVAIVQKRWDEIPPPVDKKKRMY